MKKFIDTLVRLPNLRRLELMYVSHRSPVTAQLKRKCAIFPNIRELIVDDIYPDFIKSCPNLESLAFRHRLGECALQSIRLYGAGLKRVTGVFLFTDHHLEGKFTTHRLRNLLTRIGPSTTVVVQSCPKLQEIGLIFPLYVCLPPFSAITVSVFDIPQEDRPVSNRVFDLLRQVRHLTVVEVVLNERRTKNRVVPPPDALEGARNSWKRNFIDVLENNISKDPESFRCRVVTLKTFRRSDHSTGCGVIESGKVEVLP